MLILEYNDQSAWGDMLDSMLEVLAGARQQLTYLIVGQRHFSKADYIDPTANRVILSRGFYSDPELDLPACMRV